MPSEAAGPVADTVTPTLMSAWAAVARKAVAASFEGYAKPHEEGLLKVWDKVAAEIGPLDTLAKALEARQGKSGIDEKASRG